MADPNPYFDLLEQQENQRQQQLAAGIAATSTLTYGVDPDAAARARQTAGFLGVPAAVVEAAPQDAERQARIRMIDTDTAKAPTLRQRYTDADFMKLASDDSGVLSTVERTVRSLFARDPQPGEEPGLYGTVVNSASRGISQLLNSFSVTGLRGNAGALGTLDRIEQALASGRAPESFKADEDQFSAALMTPEQRANLRSDLMRQLERQAGDVALRNDIAAGVPRRAVVDEVFNAGKAEGLKGMERFPAVWSAFTKDPVGFIASIGPESMVGNAPGLALALPAGIAFGPAGAASVMGGGSFTTDYAASIQEALQNAGVDTADKDKLLAAVQNPELMRKVGREAFAHAAIVSAVDAASTGVASKVALPGKVLAKQPLGRELANLAVQAPTQGTLGAAGEFGGQAAAGQEIDPANVLAEFAGEFFGSPAEVVSATAGHIGTRIATARADAARAEETAAKVEQLAKVMEASKLRGRDATEFSQFVAQIAEERGEAPAELYVDAQQMSNVLNQSAMTMTELRAIAPAVAAQLEAAHNVPGADVRVPVAELAAAGPEVTTALLDHLRAAPDAMSRAEARDFMAREGEQIQQQVQQALGQMQEEQAFRDSRAAVQEDVLQQLKAAGRFGDTANAAYASLWANFFATQAARAGVAPQELYQRFGPKIVANTKATALLDQFVPVKPLAQSARPTDTPEFQSWFEGSKAVDEKGAPRVVYHGTSADFEVFDRKQAGSNTGAANTKLGFFFTSRPDVAGNYAGRAEGANVMPVYLALRNPLHLTAPNMMQADKMLMEQLQDEHDGAIIEVGEGERKQTVYMVRNEAQAKSATGNRGTFDPNDPSILHQEGDEADITRGSFDPSSNTLALLAAADLSTFLHESGHFFLEVQADLAARIENEAKAFGSVAPAEQQIVDDMNRILTWFGVTGTPQQSALQQWLEMSLDEKRQFHEQWARGFERYLMEGEAPSLELQQLFARFRAWLVQVYRTLTSLNVELSPDVRDVMGRMLASDAAISEAQDARALGPLFRSPEKAGMTPEEFADYQATAERATAAASAQLDARLMKDMRWLSKARDKALKARQAEVDHLRREVRREVSADIMATPIYQAWQFLTGRRDRVQGDKRAGGVGEEHENLFAAIGRLGGLDAAQVKKQWGVSTKDDTIKSGIFGKPVLRKTGGLSLDAMAERLVEAGYLLPDEHGKADLAKFEALFDDQRRGVDRFSIRKQYEGEKPVEGLNLPSEFASGRLDTEALKAMYGDSPEAKWRLLSERRMTSPTGIHPDIVAETFGFESGDQLVNQLVRARPPAEVIDELTDQQMLQRHGDIASPQALQRAADEAVHNELRARVIAQELKALAKATTVRASGDSLYGRSTVDVMAKAARDYAAKVIARQKIKDLRPAQYAAAEARSAKLAEQSLGKSTSEAAMHKRNQLVNNFATKAAYDAQREVQDGREFFRKVLTGAQDKVSKTRDFDVVQAARAILADYGIGTRGEAAQRYLEAVQRNDPAMYQVLRDKVDTLTLNAKPLNELTVDEFRGLREEIEGLWHLAKRSRQMEVDGKLIDIESAKIPLVDRMQAIGIPDRVPGEGRAVTDAERRVSRLRSAAAALRRVESWVEAKDGKAFGPFRDFVWQPVKEAADRYRADKAKHLKAYRDLLGGVEFPVARVDAPELGYTFGFSRGGSGKAEILHALLHTGNESNKRKLLLGRQWGQVMETGELDTRRWDAFVNRMVREGVLTRADFEFAQGVWDLLEGMKPLAQKTHRDVFGRYFDEITAQGFTVQFPDGPAAFRGGYVPAVMDPEVVKDAATRALQEDENATLAYAFPSTPKGFTKTRVEINRPLLLDLRYLAQHIDKVLLFSHLEQPIRDVRKVLTSKEVSEPLHRIDPAAFDGILTPWMNRAARQTVETKVPGDNNLMRFFAKARSRAGMAAMFANVANAAQQITGLSIAAVQVRPGLLADAAVQWVKAPRQVSRAVAEASPYMAGRMDNEVAQMTDAIEQILLNPSVYEKAQAWTAKHAYFLQSAIDNVVGPIVWTSAYNHALEQGRSEQDARRHADAVVRQTQGSTLPEDVARFETGNAFVRMFTQFAGYFNMQANLLGTEFANILHEQGLRRGMGRGLYVFVLGFMVPAMVSELIVQGMKGGPDDEDKDGSTLDDWLMAVLLMSNVRAGLAMVPGVGQGANAFLNTFNHKPYDDRISTSPAISMIESAVKAPIEVYKAIKDDGNRRAAVRDLATFISMTTGLPANAIARPLGYMAGVGQDKIAPTGPADMARGLVTGMPSPDSKR